MEKLTLMAFTPLFCLDFEVNSDDWLRTPRSRDLSVKKIMEISDTLAQLLRVRKLCPAMVYSPEDLQKFIESKFLLHRNFETLKDELFKFFTFSCEAPKDRLNMAEELFKSCIANTMEAVRTGIFLAKGIKDNVYAYVTLPDMGLTPPDVIDVAIEIAKVYYGETIEADYFDSYLGEYNWKKMTAEQLGAACLDVAVDHKLDRR